MSRELIDLHVHTTASDGTLSPGELIRYARGKNLAAVAITDHDTVEGLPEAIREADRIGFELVPGVEISVDYPGKEMHILGYYMDVNDPKLVESLGELRRYREERNPKIIRKLQELGMDVTMEEVAALAGGNVVGRPHFAALMVEKGYVADPAEAFEKYLATGKPAYVKKERLTPEQGISLIRDAGGIPVLAHPKYISGSVAVLVETLSNLKAHGLRGIEAYYSTHSTPETEAFVHMANELGLLVTGGTDFHGANKPDLEIGIGTGTLRVPYKILEELKGALSRQ